ncbi:MAG: MerR family transcriptional regulator [Crocinitomicaceae bacterium]|nr:MerR family transcriptional regulator [Crocinitomicaceae bacterium]MDP4866188.1 MerR family transcriptional regulator [Crocinitomicaceae bacterium]MDP5010698.1 MerR family transcriptional regulator [Crocinitomicaceae bacterium]
MEIEKLTKLYYTIGEVADMFSVNASLIRFWEKEFAIIQPKKNKKGNRLFTTKDIENFNKIYQLVKINGYTLDGAKKALKSKELVNEEVIDTDDNMIVINRLENIKQRLQELKG